MIRRPPRSTRTEHSFPTRRSSDLDPVSVNVSGRYDRYSGGLDNFSPKVGVKFTPIQQVVLRGTYSRGFRVPSFGEADATFPTTGYVTASRGIYPDSYLAQYGCTSEPNDYNTNRSEAHTSELQS